MGETRDADLTGRWAVCSIGRIGHIEGRKDLDWGLSWVGTGIDGKPWASRTPRVICEADVALISPSFAAPPSRGTAEPPPLDLMKALKECLETAEPPAPEPNAAEWLREIVAPHPETPGDQP